MSELQQQRTVSEMDNRHRQPPALKKLKQLLFISLFITIFSFLLLLWSYKNEATQWKKISLSMLPKKKQFLPKSLYFQTTTASPTSQNITEPQGCTVPTEKLANKAQTDSFIRVISTKTLLVSAYLEHRMHEKQVRVIAVVQRSETVAYHCQLCCENQNHSSKGYSFIHSDHFDFPYGTADILFPLPSGCKTPSHIAVNSAAAKFEDKHNHEYLEVKNQKAETKDFSYNFTVCISTMFDFTNVLQLVQSLEMLQLLGVDRVVIYKTSCSAETQRILDYYTQKGLVEVILWPASKFLKVSRGWLFEDSPGDIHYFAQIPALNDCLYRYMYRSKYLALHDIDELILPQTVDSWSDLLPLLEKKYGSNKCYMFENNLFPIDVMLPPPTQTQDLPPNNHWNNVSGVNILAHLHQNPIMPEKQYENFKIIVNPRLVFTTSVHGVLNSKDGCSWVDRSMARMYHTRPNLKGNVSTDQLIYDGRLLNYSGRLVTAVDAALKYNGLLFGNSTHQPPYEDQPRRTV